MNLALAGVYQVEMNSFGKISEQELDRLFSGSPSAELNDLASFVQKAQSTYLVDLEQGVDSTLFSGLMRTVNLTDKGDLAARPASNVTGPGIQASGLPKIRRRFMLESLLASLAAKLAVGGISIAMAATGLAATGNLPDDVQSGAADVAANIGISIPNPHAVEKALAKADKALEKATLKAEKAAEVSDDGDDTGEVDGDEGEAPNEKDSFGKSVSADARDGGVDGQEISAAAHARNEARQAAKGLGSDDAADADEADADAADADDADEADDAADADDADDSDADDADDSDSGKGQREGSSSGRR